ncbi:MAG: GNAT family N-acetyltransferase [Tissierellales bacterium]|jgi:RimJ/RimL family protein N-acetyltransferase|nr:GNAT family N-acetyltransferase [Tissierellales bacterium]
MQFKVLTSYDKDMIHTLEKWYNDPDILPYLHPNFTGEDLDPITPAEIRMMVRTKPNRKRYGIYDEKRWIGEVSILEGFDNLVATEPRTAWIGLCVGEKDYWRTGVGRQAMLFLEQEAKQLGFKRIELGVFEHNTKARKLYENLGYKEISTLAKFTYYNGNWYDDIRMEKYI